VSEAISRQVVATGTDAAVVARQIAAQLVGPGLRIAFVFADWRLDPETFARSLYETLRAPVVGGTTTGVIGPGAPADAMSAVGLGLYGDWVQVGLGVASELPKGPLTRSRDAVHHAAAALGRSVDMLDPSRHVAITLVDGTVGHEEAFCIGSAAAAPKIRFVGGSTGSQIAPARRAAVWINGEAMSDAGLVVLLESELPFHVLRSAHLVPTDHKTVVTAASGRVIDELDGRPAGTRLRELIEQLGDTLEDPPTHTFARYVDGVPYVRSMTHVEGERIHLACGIEPGHVLRIMRPGDLISTTKQDLAAACERVGGQCGALLAFSCMGRHWEAGVRHLDHELTQTYAAYPTVGFQTMGEQSGLLLVNHTLMGLVIGAPK